MMRQILIPSVLNTPQLPGDMCLTGEEVLCAQISPNGPSIARNKTQVIGGDLRTEGGAKL